MRKFLIKLDRIAAWVLFIGVVLYFITGYGMTKGIISSGLSADLHLDWLVYIVILAFLIHAPYAIHLAFRRWNFWNLFSKILLAVFIIAFVAFIIWVEFIYEKKATAAVPETEGEEEILIEDKGEENNIIDEEAAEEDGEEVDGVFTEGKIFTAEELSRYDGQSGQPAYVAVDGNVYDMTGVFDEGFHYSHFAGRDLTGAFYREHAKRYLDGYPIVGKLSD